MKLHSLGLLWLVVMMSCALASAQEAVKPNVPQHLEKLADQSQSPSQTSAQPPAELQSLMKALSGKWAVSVKFGPSKEMPKGFAGTGEEAWRSGPGGYTLLDEEHFPTAFGEVYLLGIIWWDSQTKSFHGMECNNQLPYGCDLKGGLNDITMSWDGKQFIIDEWETHGGKKTLWHEVWSGITPTSFTQTGDVQVPGGATTRFFTMRATRMPDAAQ
jgi:hypothetical protein